MLRGSRGNNGSTALRTPLTDLLRFIEHNFIPLNTMMERAGMSEMDIYNRTRDVFLTFNLPYDAPPPITT